MSVRNVQVGWAEYPTAAEAYGQQLWIYRWREENWAAIRPGWTVDLAALLVPSVNAGNARLSWEFHYDTVTSGEALALHDALVEHTGVGSTDESDTYGAE